MNRPQRSIEIFTMSALDLFVTAMGSFAILMMILFPYYNADKLAEGAKKAAEDKKQKQDGPAGEVKGETVLFCIHPTRIEDFEKFLEATGYDGDDPKTKAFDPLPLRDAIKNPGYDQAPDHPVVGVTWLDAMAFCDWLTKKEREAAAIGPEDYYRLPTDEEWSAAVGTKKFAWGDEWPPPEGSGNLAGMEYGDGADAIGLRGYRDGIEFTAPVASFAPNAFGVYDLAGNVMQWCLDWYRGDMNPPDIRQAQPFYGISFPEQTRRVVRGSSWRILGETILRSGLREPIAQRTRQEDLGFRCVLVVNQPPVK